MTFLENRVPPPIVMLAFGLIAWLLKSGFETTAEPGIAIKWLAGLCILAGIVIAALAGKEFKNVGTTVNPLAPDQASTLVTTGVFKRTRNPMYLGMLLILFAWCFFLSSPLAFIVLPFFVLYITRFQIGPEEEAMKKRFGEQYEAYCEEVARWV